MGLADELYYMRNRWYEPHTGRFLSEDPLGLAGGLDLYGFSSNDPMNGADPTGLQVYSLLEIVVEGYGDEWAAYMAVVRSGAYLGFGHTGPGWGLQSQPVSADLLWGSFVAKALFYGGGHGSPSLPARPPKPQQPAQRGLAAAGPCDALVHP